MIRKNQKLQKTSFLLAIIIIQGISDIFYSIQELSGIFMEFSSRDIKKYHRICLFKFPEIGFILFYILLYMLWNFLSILDTFFIGHFILSGIVFDFIFILFYIYILLLISDFLLILILNFELLSILFSDITIFFFLSFTCLLLFSLSCRMSWKTSEYWTLAQENYRRYQNM